MSQTLAQLVGNVSTGAVFAGIVTTASADIGYGAVGINSTGINVSGVTTSSGGFVGSLTGTATGLTGTPNITVGVVTATSFIGSGANLTDLNIPTGFNELDSALFS